MLSKKEVKRLINQNRNIFNYVDKLKTKDVLEGMTDEEYNTNLTIINKYNIDNIAGIVNVNTAQKVSVECIQDKFMLKFYYNPNIIKVIKSFDGQLNTDSCLWWIKKDKIKIGGLIEGLKQIGVCTSNIEEYIASINMDTSTKVIPKSDKITINKITKNRVVISFEYNRKVVECIKMLIDRYYNPSSKTWSINKMEVENLIILFQQNNIGMDYEDLKAIIDKKVREVYPLKIPNTRKPFPHQIEAGEYLLKRGKCILADDMGMGKTYESIMAGNSIEGIKYIVCPASLKLNWAKEIKCVNPNATIEVIHSKWKPIEENNVEWYIINYDILDRFIEVIKHMNPKCLIVDEAHCIKSVSNSGKPNSIRAKCVLELAKEIDFVWYLTGTPIPNHTKDIYNMLHSVSCPAAINFWQFGKRYCGAVNNGWGWNFNGSTNTEELKKHIEPYMLRRLKGEGIPEKTRNFIPLQVNMKSYIHNVNEYMNKRNGLTEGEKIVYLNALRILLAKEKIKYTIDFVKNNLEKGESVVVFTNYKEVLEKIYEKFSTTAVKVDGSCSSDERQEAVDKFQAGEKKVFVGNLQACGTGLTLTKSRTLVFNDFSWLPSDMVQGEDRICRIGQTNNCTIAYMYAINTIDEYMAEKIDDKLRNSTNIVDGKEDSILKDVESFLFNR